MIKQKLNQGLESKHIEVIGGELKHSSNSVLFTNHFMSHYYSSNSE